MEFLQYEFMQKALMAGLITAVICPVIGIFVVVRRQSLVGDGLGHIAFAGVMGGYLLNIYPVAAAAAITVLGAAGIEYARQRHAQYADTALAIFFYFGMALAIIFSSMARVPGNGMMAVLFGSIITVSKNDLVHIAASALIVLTVMYLLFDKLMLIAFDEEVAHTAGIRTNLINYVFSMLTAMVVVIGMRVIGILLISALMIIPVAAAQQLRRGFRETLFWAVVFSVIAVFGGLWLSFALNIAPGGTIVVIAVGIYLLALFGFRTKSIRKVIEKTSQMEPFIRHENSD